MTLDVIEIMFQRGKRGFEAGRSGGRAGRWFQDMKLACKMPARLAGRLAARLAARLAGRQWYGLDTRMARLGWLAARLASWLVDWLARLAG